VQIDFAPCASPRIVVLNLLLDFSFDLFDQWRTLPVPAPKKRPTNSTGITPEHIRAAADLVRAVTALLLVLLTTSAGPETPAKGPVDTIQTGSVK
jgi:hypothetical protein